MAIILDWADFASCRVSLGRVCCQRATPSSFHSNCLTFYNFTVSDDILYKLLFYEFQNFYLVFFLLVTINLIQFSCSCTPVFQPPMHSILQSHFLQQNQIALLTSISTETFRFYWMQDLFLVFNSLLFFGHQLCNYFFNE